MIYLFLTSSLGKVKKEDSPAERAQEGELFQPGSQEHDQQEKKKKKANKTKQRVAPNPVPRLPSYPCRFTY